MRHHRRFHSWPFPIAAALALIAGCEGTPGREEASSLEPCKSGITVPAGFCATVFADKLGGVRHIVVAPNGDVYAVRWEAKGRPGGLLALRDTTGDGRADVIDSIANSGGSGLAIRGAYLYQSTWTDVLRYRLRKDTLAPDPTPDTVLSGLPKSGHAARSVAFDMSDRLYLNIGAHTNSCQVVDRGVRSMGRDPCPEREAFAGIWRFDPDRLRQKQSDGERWVFGIRHVVALAFDSITGTMFGVPHGRDDLSENFPHIYDEARGARLPPEVMYRLADGADFGWPYCYFDDSLDRAVLAPEYGGDGVRSTRCETAPKPVAIFPAHWSPNGLLFYRGTQFPAHYRGGAFIAFHGGYYRPPPDNGFNVVFVPLADGRVTSRYEIFADEFAGRHKRPQLALHRPVGLAQGPDGALFISDDAGGRIWRITYSSPPGNSSRADTSLTNQ